VATNHGGEVSAHSVEGEGSRFVLRLPAFAEPSPVPPSPAPMRSNRGS
jgi:signal transduction histidine kinase